MIFFRCVNFLGLHDLRIPEFTVRERVGKLALSNFMRSLLNYNETYMRPVIFIQQSVGNRHFKSYIVEILILRMIIERLEIYRVGLYMVITFVYGYIFHYNPFYKSCCY